MTSLQGPRDYRTLGATGQPSLLTGCLSLHTPFTHWTPATRAFFLLLQAAKLTPTPGPLHRLLPLPDLFYTRMDSSLSFVFPLWCHVLRESLPSPQPKWSTQSLWSHYLIVLPPLDISLPLLFACPPPVESREQAPWLSHSPLIPQCLGQCRAQRRHSNTNWINECILADSRIWGDPAVTVIQLNPEDFPIFPP